MFNRGGEPWFTDLSLKTKTKKTRICLLLGETGTEKSNTAPIFWPMHALDCITHDYLLSKPVDSFDLLADYCASLGLSVNK